MVGLIAHGCIHSLFFFFFSYSFKIFECALSVKRKKPYVYFSTESGPQNPSQHSFLDSLNPFLPNRHAGGYEWESTSHMARDSHTPCETGPCMQKILVELISLGIKIVFPFKVGEERSQRGKIKQRRKPHPIILSQVCACSFCCLPWGGEMPGKFELLGAGIVPDTISR